MQIPVKKCIIMYYENDDDDDDDDEYTVKSIFLFQSLLKINQSF